MHTASMLDASAFDAAMKIVARLSRRDFMRFSAAAAAASAAGRLAAAPADLKFISDSEAAVFTRLAQVVLPVAGSPLAPWTPEGLLQTLDAALLGTMEPHILAGLKGGVAYFDAGPVASYGKRFTALDDEQATRFCDEWGNGTQPPQRALAMGLKKLVQLSYWANPASWAPLEYDGPMSRRLGLPSLGNAPLPRA
jgi:hypothetical protein